MRGYNGRFLHPDPQGFSLDQQFAKAGYNPAEPRDDHARWTRDEGSENAEVSDVQYRGRFHDLVGDDFLDGLQSRGATVLKNVRVLGLNGILAIPDGASKPSETTHLIS